MTTESLKEEARRYEQREDWVKALELYLQAIEARSEEEEPDIALHNRVGDLQIRLGDVDGAVSNYEAAIDLYLAADLPNNAIAICRKIIRNDPMRPAPFLRMGQVRASQGFLVDARQNFLTYAEMMQHQGQTDEALRALEEFAGLAPEDVETVVFLAEQLVSRERDEEALVHLTSAYRVLTEKGEEARANGILDRIRELAPDRPLPGRIDEVQEEVESAAPPEPGVLSGFESTSLGFAPEEPDLEIEIEAEVDSEAEAEAELEPEVTPDVELGEEVTEPVGGLSLDEAPARDFSFADISFNEDAPDDSGLELGQPDLEEEFEDDARDDSGLEFGQPDFEEESEEEEDAPVELPFMSFGDAPEEEVQAEEEVEIPLLGFGELELEVEGEDEEAEAVEEEEPIGSLRFDEPHPASEAFESAVETSDAPDLEPEFAEEPSEEAPDLVANLRARLARDPRDAEGWRRLGEELFARGEETEGREALERAHRAYAGGGDPERAMQVVRELIQREPGSLELRQRVVEYAYQSDRSGLLVQAFLELADILRESGEQARSEAVYQQVLTIDPENPRAREGAGIAPPADEPALPQPSDEPAPPPRTEERAPPPPSADYVDLGALVLDEDQEETTRWVVPAETPTGDDAADFARMLSQFKEKVAKNLSADDATSHYDLGTAFKEMGLLDEAIGQFQQSLRADPRNLAAFEMLGRSFLDNGQAEAAIRTLERGLRVPTPVEDDLLGIYYFMGRSHETVGNTDAAKEFYEKVFSLDINFHDVTDRLRALR